MDGASADSLLRESAFAFLGINRYRFSPSPIAAWRGAGPFFVSPTRCPLPAASCISAVGDRPVWPEEGRRLPRAGKQLGCSLSSARTRPMKAEKPATLAGRIEAQILLIRGQRVMLDADLAALYGVSTRVLTQAVKRNRERFPEDFMFPLRLQRRRR